MPTNRFLQTFFDILNAGEVSYCVLRNYLHLPKSLNGSDLDILVVQKDVEKFYLLLNDILDRTNGKIIVQYGSLAPRICIIGGKSNSWYGVQIDVHAGILPYKTSHMFSVDLVLSRARIYKGILVAHDDDAALIAFLKEILNNKKCSKKYFEIAKSSWKNNRTFYIPELAKIYDEKFVSLLSDILVGTYDQEKTFKLAQVGQNCLTKNKSTKVRNFKSRISRLYRIIHPPGYSIAVLGTDGAGKTTVINAIREPLNEADHNALFYEHMRPNLLPNIAQLFGGKKQSGPVTDPHAAKPSGLLGSLLRLLYYSVDYIWGYWIKIYPIMVKKSSIWIFDRYYYDYLIDPKRARINLPDWIIKSVKFFIPDPDLILCLGAEPVTIHNRKPELPLDEVMIQVRKLKKFCDNEKKAVWIDTSNSIEETVNQVMNTISNKMAERF